MWLHIFHASYGVFPLSGHDVPHGGHLIAIDQLSYHDPPSHTSLNRTTPSVAYAKSMHYVSTPTIGGKSTPIECEPTTLVSPPHHFSLEVGRVHPPLGEATSSVSPIYKSNFSSSPTVTDGINSFHSPQHPTHQCSFMSYLTSSTIGPDNFISMGSPSPPTPSLMFKKDGTSTTLAPMKDIDHQPMVPTPTISSAAQLHEPDTLFQILFCGCMTLNCIILYLWSIILGIWWAFFPQYLYQDTGGNTTTHGRNIHPTSQH